MIAELTKEELLKRVMELPDGVIDDETLDIITQPDNSEEQIIAIKRLNRMRRWNGEEGMHGYQIGGTLTYQGHNDILREYLSKRKNVTNVNVPSFGIKPNDLDHPVEPTGFQWNIRLKKSGAFEKTCGNWRFDSIKEYDFNKTKDEIHEELFSKLDGIIKHKGWVHTYILSISSNAELEGSDLGTSIRNYLVKMTGITSDELKEMKKLGHADTSVNLDDLIEAGIVGSFI